ncbi:g4010 [Coccomyxa elongata]
MEGPQQRRVGVLLSHVTGSSQQSSQLGVLSENVASSPQLLLKGKVAIITGSGQGLGAAAAKLFAQQGARLMVTDLDAAKADQVAAEIRSQGGEAISLAGDVTAEDFPARCVKATVDAFGTIDILINNAGFTWDGMIHKITPKQWDAMLAVHCTAPFRLIQAAAPVMRDAAKKELDERGEATQRCIINVSSTSGTHGNAGQANYSTAKAGVVGLTKTVAREWGAFNIRCNAIAYGFIATRLTADKGSSTISVGGQQVKLGIPGGEAMASAAAEMLIPLKRIGTPEEAAGAMLLLASPYASFISGQTLEVTGGAYI